MLWYALILFMLLMAGSIGRILLRQEAVMWLSLNLSVILLVYFLYAYSNRIHFIDINKMNQGIEKFTELKK